MMKKLIYSLSLLAFLAMTGCGSDDPVIDRNRDFQFTVSELFLIGSTSPTATTQPCDIVVHRQKSTADIVLRLDTDGNGVSTLRLTDLPLSYDAVKNHYTAHAQTTSDPRVTDFVCVIDCNDFIAEMNFVLDGITQVTATSNELFYGRSRTEMTFSDNTSHTDATASYMLTIDPDGASTVMRIGDLFHKKDILTYKTITLTGLTTSLADGGLVVSGDKVLTEKGEYSRLDYTTGAPTSQLGDSLLLRFDNLKATVNLTDNTMNGSWTMVRLKRVTDTIQRTPEVRTEVKLVEVDRTVMNTKASLY